MKLPFSTQICDFQLLGEFCTYFMDTCICYVYFVFIMIYLHAFVHEIINYYQHAFHLMLRSQL